MENEKMNAKPGGEKESQEVSTTRRALLRAGWTIPVVLAAASTSFAGTGPSTGGEIDY